MGRRCAIKNCDNRKNKPINTIHAFPSADTSTVKRALWEEFAEDASGGESGIKIYSNFGICSKHFTHDDYMTDEIGASGNLKTDAVPSIQGTSKSSSTEEVEELRKMITDMQEKDKANERASRSLRKQVESLSKSNAELKAELRQKEEALEKVLSIFTDGQKKRLFNSGQKTHWGTDDIIRGLELFSLSEKSYKLVRTKWKLPLPPESVLNTHLQNLNIQPDVPFPSVLSIVNARHINMNSDSLQALCMLAIDEIAINSCYVYDPALDQVFGGFKNITVFCARGLFSKWKQPIMYSFHPDEDQLDRVLRELHEHGLFVVGIISDMGPKNQKLWKKLGIGKVHNRVVESTHFFSKTLNRKTFWFPDIVHLIKLLRNHVLDSKLTLEDGTVIDITWFEDLIAAQQKHEFRLTDKLGYKHIYLQGQQRQNVRTAFRLFSHHVAQAIRTLLPHRPNYDKVADFIDFLNDFCDLMNTRTDTESANPFQSPFGKRFEEQQGLLKKALHVFTTMVVGGRKKALAPFQKGLLMNIESSINLFEMLKNDYPDFKYLLMHRLNQDFLENLFSVIRGFGGFKSHPNSVELKYRLRKVAAMWYLFDEDQDDTINDRFTTLMNKFTPSQFLPAVEDDEDLPYSQETHDRLEAVEGDLNCGKEYTFANFDYEETCVEGGKEYVAGYIAQRLSEKFPELCAAGANEPTRNFWVASLSKGGLVEPSNIWFALFTKFDEYFCAIHPENGIDRKLNTIARLVEFLQERHPTVPKEVVKFYAKVRMNIRIRHLNKMEENKKFINKERKRSIRCLDEEEDQCTALSATGEELLNRFEILF